MRTLKNINIKQCIINKKADKHNLNFVNYRLYVFAFGSLMTVILNCLTLISVSFLHFGQNSGNFSSTVSSLIFTRVLFLHTGHNNHCNDFSCSCNIFVSRIIMLFGFDRSTGQQHYFGYIVWKGCGENFFKGCPASFPVI